MVEVLFAAVAGQTRTHRKQKCWLPQLRSADWLRLSAGIVVLMLVFSVLLASAHAPSVNRSSDLVASRTADRLPPAKPLMVPGER